MAARTTALWLHRCVAWRRCTRLRVDWMIQRRCRRSHWRCIGGSMAARTTTLWLYRCDASLSAYHLNLATAALVAQSQTTRRSCSTHPPTVCLFCVHSQSRTVDLAQGVGIVVLCLQNVTLHFLCCSFDCSAVLCCHDSLYGWHGS